MIKAVFYFGAEQTLAGFQLSGHAGYAETGEDIVCASVSSPAYMVANTVTEILHLSPEIRVDGQSGFMKLLLCKAEQAPAQDILQGFLLHIKGLSEMYPDYIQVERGAFSC